MSNQITICLLLTALVSGFLFSCSNNRVNTLEQYALEVRDSTKPGNAVINYINSLETVSPEKQLAFSYYDLLSKWTYIIDSDSNDHFASAERMFKTNDFKGDCEDLASAIFSICRAKKINSRICLGENSNAKSGHAWVEIELCRQTEFDTTFSNQLLTLFSSDVTIYSRDSFMFLGFIEDSSLQQYRITHYIDTLGNLTKVD